MIEEPVSAANDPARGERPLSGLTSGGGEPLGEPGEARREDRGSASPELESRASASPEAHVIHRIAMAAAVGALVASGTSFITGWDAVRTSYPGFDRDLATLKAGGAR